MWVRSPPAPLPCGEQAGRSNGARDQQGCGTVHLRGVHPPSPDYWRASQVQTGFPPFGRGFRWTPPGRNPGGTARTPPDFVPLKPFRKDRPRSAAEESKPDPCSATPYRKAAHCDFLSRWSDLDFFRRARSRRYRMEKSSPPRRLGFPFSRGDRPTPSRMVGQGRKVPVREGGVCAAGNPRRWGASPQRLGWRTDPHGDRIFGPSSMGLGADQEERGGQLRPCPREARSAT